jgi:hypothetical protein
MTSAHMATSTAEKGAPTVLTGNHPAEWPRRRRTRAPNIDEPWRYTAP